MEQKIQLGDTVKCKYTGFKGVVVSMTEFINGCVQFGVAPKVGKDNKYNEELGIDEESLEIITKPKKKKVKRMVINNQKHGGRTRCAKLMRGF